MHLWTTSEAPEDHQAGLVWARLRSGWSLSWCYSLPSLCLQPSVSVAQSSHLHGNLLPSKGQIHMFLLRSMNPERGVWPPFKRDWLTNMSILLLRRQGFKLKKSFYDGRIFFFFKTSNSGWKNLELWGGKRMCCLLTIPMITCCQESDHASHS